MVLMEFVSPGQIQGDLFAPPPRPGREALMATLDRINARMGRGTVAWPGCRRCLAGGCGRNSNRPAT
jgi:hypothetical protein